MHLGFVDEFVDNNRLPEEINHLRLGDVDVLVDNKFTSDWVYGCLLDVYGMFVAKKFIKKVKLLLQKRVSQKVYTEKYFLNDVNLR